MFNFERGKPIARISGGPLNGKYVFWKKDKLTTSVEEVDLTEGIFIPCPNIEDERVDRLMINGLTGCGKSYFAGNYVEDLLKLWPEKRLILISPVCDDKAYEGLDPICIDLLDDDEEVPEIEQLKDSVVVFDDVDSLSNEKKLKKLKALMKQTLQRGRHLNIDTLVCGHVLMDGPSTKYLINESNKLIMYPQGGNFKQQETMLKTYMGYDKETIRRIINSDSRWVLIHKEVPQYILTEYELYVPENKYKN